MNAYDFVRPATKALWTFDDEDGADASSYGNDLLLGSPDYRLGRFGQCVQFDGSNYLRSDFPSYASLQLTDLTIHYWVKPDTFAPRWQTVFSFHDYDETLYGYETGLNYDNIFFGAYSGPDILPQFVGSISLDDDEWHWIVITNSTITGLTQIYVDGKLDLSDSRQNIAFNGYELVDLGAFWYDMGSTAWDFFTGCIDNLHVMSGALGQDNTIRRMYASMRGWL